MNNPNDREFDQGHPEWLAQQAATTDASGARSRATADYCRIHDAIAAAPMPGLPADFAARVLARIDDLAEHATPERNLLITMGIVMFGATLYFIAPVTTKLLDPLAGMFDSPWVMPAVVTIVAVAVMDRVSAKRFARP